MYSNVAESFNSWICDSRYLLITDLIDTIRCNIMKLSAMRRDEAKAWTDFFVHICIAISESPWRQVVLGL